MPTVKKRFYYLVSYMPVNPIYIHINVKKLKNKILYNYNKEDIAYQKLCTALTDNKV